MKVQVARSRMELGHTPANHIAVALCSRLREQEHECMILAAKPSFGAFDDLPRQALTRTVPTLLAGHEFFCCVAGLLKSAAVQAMPDSPVSGECPLNSAPNPSTLHSLP